GLKLRKVWAVGAVIDPAPLVGPDRDAICSRIECPTIVNIQKYSLERRQPRSFRAPPHDLRRCWNWSRATHRAGWGSRQWHGLLFRMAMHSSRLERRLGRRIPT